MNDIALIISAAIIAVVMVGTVGILMFLWKPEKNKHK